MDFCHFFVIIASDHLIDSTDSELISKVIQPFQIHTTLANCLKKT